MLRNKKKSTRKENDEPEEENTEVDFDRIFLIGRAKFLIDQKTLEYMTMGQWSDIFRSYRELYNFEAKKMLYRDVEEEWQQYQIEHQETTSILDLMR